MHRASASEGCERTPGRGAHGQIGPDGGSIPCHDECSRWRLQVPQRLRQLFHPSSIGWFWHRSPYAKGLLDPCGMFPAFYWCSHCAMRSHHISPGQWVPDPGEEGVDQTHGKGPCFRCVKAWGFGSNSMRCEYRIIQKRLRYEQIFWNGSADMLKGWVLPEEECSHASGAGAARAFDRSYCQSMQTCGF